MSSLKMRNGSEMDPLGSNKLWVGMPLGMLFVALRFYKKFLLQCRPIMEIIGYFMRLLTYFVSSNSDVC